MAFKKENGIEVIELGDNKISVSWLRSVSELVAMNSGKDRNQMRNAWKQANGKSVRKYTLTSTEEEKAEKTKASKPKRKRTAPKKDQKK